jgi:CheY-like chemotaxis protein
LPHGRTVLVIEDEAVEREATAGVLAAWGSCPRLAADTGEAVLEARQQPPDLIVADLRLRDGASGLEAIADVWCACGRIILALVVTGDIQVEILKEARDRGHIGLHKPVSPARLRATLSQLLAPRPEPRLHRRTPRPWRSSPDDKKNDGGAAVASAVHGIDKRTTLESLPAGIRDMYELVHKLAPQ